VLAKQTPPVLPPLPSQTLRRCTPTPGAGLQVRLDLLGYGRPVDSDLYLALDTATGGVTRLPLGSFTEIEWDTLVIVPASGTIRALDREMQRAGTWRCSGARSGGGHAGRQPERGRAAGPRLAYRCRSSGKPR
jgi:hypothetical protein